MTRKSLKRTLRRIYALLLVILAVSFLAKIADHIVFLRDTGIERLLKDTYEFLRDMALLIATGGVAYITNVFQKRHTFLESLKEEWRDIIAAKSELLRFMYKDAPTHDDYVRAYTCLSETIDNMRTVYRNVGESDDSIGLYPYAPLHDMRRVPQPLDPRKATSTPESRKLARDTMLQSFYALRDGYLEELDLEEPDSPILMSGARRLRKPGATRGARSTQDRQIRRHKRLRPEQDAHDELLARLYAEESDRTSAPNGNDRAAVTQSPGTGPT